MGRGYAAAAMLALFTWGCSPAAQNARGRTVLESRAAFDLECPRGSLVIAPLSRNGHGTITSYGVEGCGRRATYVQLSDSTWLMNPPAGAPAPGMVPRRPMRVPAERRPEPVPLPPTAAPHPEPAPPPSGSAERSPERPPNSLQPGERAPRLPDLPGQGERPSPLDQRR
jgi:hypothetical protein